MENYVREYIEYLRKRKTSENTISSYRRDLLKLCGFLETHNITNIRDITNTNLNSYILTMEEANLASSSISRAIASIRSFFSFLDQKRYIDYNMALELKAPKVVKKSPDFLSEEEIEGLLAQLTEHSSKELRDKAMLELLYATGMRVTELLTLKIEDLNLEMGYVTPVNRGGNRVVPVDQETCEILSRYISEARPELIERDLKVDKEEVQAVFVNCHGKTMSRQGFWKILKKYAAMATIKKDITPNMLRHSFAVHLVQNGADLQSVQELLGYADLSAAQIYFPSTKHRIKEVYDRAHNRKFNK